MKIRKFAGATAAMLVAILSAAAAAPAARAGTVNLDPELRTHLAGLEGIAGRDLSVRMLQQRAVVVAFFSSWCKPCDTEFEHLKILQLAHAAEGMTIVAVDIMENHGKAGMPPDTKRLKLFLDRHVPVFSVVKADSDTARLFGGITRLPTIFVFDRSGRQRYRFVSDPAAKKINAPLGELRGAVQNALGLGTAWLPEGMGGLLAYRLAGLPPQDVPGAPRTPLRNWIAHAS